MSKSVETSNELVGMRYPRVSSRLRPKMSAHTISWKQSLANFIKVSSVLAVCLVGIALISYLLLMNQSLRLDEAQSLWQTNHSLGGTLRVVATDVHVPLYHVMLHLWQLYVANGIEGARLLSLLLFMATVPVFYILARQLLSLNWSLVATVLFSFSPFMNWYGTEIRMYTLLGLFSVLSQLFFLRILKYNKGWWGYGLVAVIGVYSHYFFFFNLLAQALFYLFNKKDFVPGAFRKLATIAGIVALGFAPWVYYFFQAGAAENTSPNLAEPSTVDLFNAFSQFALGFQGDYINTFVLSCWPLIVLMGFFAIRHNQKFPQELHYIVYAALIPVLTAYLLSIFVTPFFLSRYMVSVVAPLTILLVWLISRYPKKLGLSILGLVIIGVTLASAEQYTSANTPTKEAYRSVAQTVSQQADPQDVVVLSAPFTIYPFSYYYNGDAQIKTLPIWDRISSGAIPEFSRQRLPAEVKAINDNHRYVYLILSQDQGYESDIKLYFDTNFARKSAKTYSPDLHMYVYQVGYDQVPPLGVE